MGKKKSHSDDEYDVPYKMYDGLWGQNLTALKNRLVYGRHYKDMVCIYCGGHATTREHCPSKSFFHDNEYPPNLRVLPACQKCNNSFSKAEEIVKVYLNCIYDRYCSNKPVDDYPDRIREYVEITEHNKVLVKEAEIVFTKVAQGLAIYELCDCFGDEGWRPEVTDFICKHWVNQEEWDGLKYPVLFDILPELGTRASGEPTIAYTFGLGESELKISGCAMWTELKEGMFSYVAWLDDDAIRVRMIFRDFVYAEVSFYDEGL